MPSAAYFRRQADVCLRLSLIASDEAVSTRLVAMALGYMATIEAMERAAATRAPGTDDPSGSTAAQAAGAGPAAALEG